MIDYQSIQQILNQSDIHIIVTDESLRIVEASDRFFSHLAARGDWLGRSLVELVPELIGSDEKLLSILRGESAGFSLPMVNRELDSGQVSYLNFTALPHLAAGSHGGAEKTTDGIMFVIADISELAVVEQSVTQKRNELALLQGRLEEKNLQLEAANAELHKLDELKSKFVSIAAHDLRSPLSSVSGYLDLLQDEEFGGLSEQQNEFTGAIRRSTNRLLGIIESLLDITRIAAGRMDLVMAITDMSALLAAVENETMPKVLEKNHSLKVTIDENLPFVLCDAARTMQILHNLLLNAVKYTKVGGHICLCARVAADPAFIEIAIIDDGIGIPIEDQEWIYDSFYRAGNVYEADATGSGLGLNIARSLVELHGGEIHFESAVGEGTSFFVTFPAVYPPMSGTPVFPVESVQ